MSKRLAVVVALVAACALGGRLGPALAADIGPGHSHQDGGRRACADWFASPGDRWEYLEVCVDLWDGNEQVWLYHSTGDGSGSESQSFGPVRPDLADIDVAGGTAHVQATFGCGALDLRWVGDGPVYSGRGSNGYLRPYLLEDDYTAGAELGTENNTDASRDAAAHGTACSFGQAAGPSGSGYLGESGTDRDYVRAAV